MAITPEQAEQLRKKYNIGSNVQPSDTKQSFLSDAREDVRETLAGAKRELGQTFKTQESAIKKGFTGGQSTAETVFQFGGAAAKGLSRTGGELVLGAGKAVLPQGAEDFIGDMAGAVGNRVMNTDFAKTLMDKYSSLDERTKRNVDAALGFGELGADLVGGGIGKKVVSGGADIAMKAGREGAESVVGGVKKVGSKAKSILPSSETVQKTGEYAVGQATGFSPDTVRSIINDPNGFEIARKSGIDRLKIAEDLKSKVDLRAEKLDDLGEEYGKIRNEGASVDAGDTEFIFNTVDIGDGFLDKKLASFGFQVKDGRVIPTTKSLTRNASDISAIQNLYNTWSGRQVLESDEYFNFRKDLSELAKFDKISGKTNASESFAKAVREDLNKPEVRGQLPGLEDLDKKFSPEREILGKIQKEFFDKDGNLKDTAINKIANSTGIGKDKILEKLELIDPEIGAKIKMLKAIEDVEYARGQKVGTYLRGGLSLTAILSGNPIAGFAMFLLTSPDMMIKYLEFYGRKAPKLKPYLQGIRNKISSGEKLSADEQRVLSAALKADKKTANEFLGIISGVGVSFGVKDELSSE